MSARAGERWGNTRRKTKEDLACRRPQGVRSSHSANDASSLASQQREEVLFASPSTRSAPLTLALQAQWSVLQQSLHLGNIPVSAERDLLHVLESLPGHKNTIFSDVEGVLPYLLAFAVAPIPSERTQVIALGAVQATISSLIEVWGRKAVAVLVHDFLVVEHNALRALEVTLSVALGDAGDEINKNADGHGRRQEEVFDSTVLDTRRTVIGGALELVLTMVTVSTSTTAALLTHPKLIQNIVQCLPEATPLQACDVANILYTLSAVDAAADTLVACKAYHASVLYIRRSMRGAEHGDISPNTTVTALCTFLRLAVRLTSSALAFVVLQEDPSTPLMMGELLCSQWSEVVELGCRWLFTVMECHLTQCSGLVSDLLSRTQAGERLANMVLWPLSMVTHAAAAALCWRWFALVHPAITSTFMVSNPNVLFSLLQVIATTPLSHVEEAAGSNDRSNRGDMLANVATEVACTLGVCYGLASRETRVGMRRLILHRISPLTQVEVQRRVESIISVVDGAYFARYPLVTLPHMKRCRSGTSLLSVNLFESTSETDREEEGGDDGGDVQAARWCMDTEGRQAHSLCSGGEWRSFLLRSLIRLFSGTARGAAEAASILRGSQLRMAAAGASAVRRAPTLMDTSRRRRRHHQEHYHHKLPGSNICPPPLEWDVVQRAQQMGGTFYLDSIRVILRLAHRYRHAHVKEPSQLANTSRSSLLPLPPPPLSSSSSSSVVATAATAAALARPEIRSGKERNPWAPPEKLEPSRRWSVEDVQRSDILLFYVSYENILTGLAQAMKAVEQQTRNIGQCLRLCPTKAVQRRCLLNDLYLNVYPKMHMFLHFIQHHMTNSQAVLQLIAERDGAVHSGNILEIYEAIGHCVDTTMVPAEGYQSMQKLKQCRQDENFTE